MFTQGTRRRSNSSVEAHLENVLITKIHGVIGLLLRRVFMAYEVNYCSGHSYEVKR